MKFILSLVVAAWLSCGIAFAQSPPAADEVSSGVTFARHPGFDRMVWQLPHGAEVTHAQTGAVLVLTAPEAGVMEGLAKAGKRVGSVVGGQGQATIVLAEGVHARIARLGDRLVVDVLDGPEGQAAPKWAASRPRLPKRAAPVTDVPGAHPVEPPAVKVAETPVARPAPSMPVQAEKLPAAPAPVVPDAHPESAPPLLARLPPPPAPTGAAVTLLPQEAGVLVPIGASAGAAAFRRGDDAVVVFDAPLEVDLSALKDDPVFGGVTARLLPDGLSLRWHLPAEKAVQMARRPEGWAIRVVQGAPAGAAIGTRAKDGVLALAAGSPGQVVVLQDEATGGRLMVGTQGVAGERVGAAHRGAEFSLLPTWQGVAVEPVSDRLSLDAVKGGFEVAAAGKPVLAMLWTDAAPGGAAEAAGMTRRFDLPNLVAGALNIRLSEAVRDAALTPKLARYGPRLEVAEAMLSAGLDDESQAVLRAAVADDPAHHDDVDAAGLSAMAAWLAARAGGAAVPVPPAAGFDPAHLGGSDEAVLWRALFQVDQADMQGPAASVAATWPLLLTYPSAVAVWAAPAAADILARGGRFDALAALVAAFPADGTKVGRALDLARAEVLKHQGKIDESLALLDKVGQRRDRLAGAAARREAVETRLSAGRLDAAAAAAALGRQLYAWRGGKRDLDLRLRLAALRGQAGQWRPALAMLRETDGLFPDDHAVVATAEGGLVKDLLHGDNAEKISPLDLVAFADEASALLSAADADTTLAPVLVDRLLALDLPDRAEPILRRLFDQAQAGAPKAELGVRLAGLLADQGDIAGALKALEVEDEGALGAALVNRRALLRARVLVASGKPDEAISALAGQDGAAATDMLAKIHEGRQEWAAAAKVLSDWVQNDGFSALPEQGKRDAILRLANDESQAGDMAGLRALRAAQHDRFASGEGADLFAVLTQEPIQSVGDLPRAQKELQRIQKLPAALAAR